jgi:hypothetical protein
MFCDLARHSNSYKRGGSAAEADVEEWMGQVEEWMGLLEVGG